jgi:hypothetical protein
MVVSGLQLSPNLAQKQFIPNAFLALLYFASIGCSCSCSQPSTSDADASDILPDDSADSSIDADPGEHDSEAPADILTEDAEADCFIPFGAGYDLSGLGLTPIPHDRPPTECGECCKQVSFSRDEITFPSSLDVWDRYLVYSTSQSRAGGDTSRIILVDLATTDEYEVESVVKGPSNYVVMFPTIHREYVYFSHSYDTGSDSGLCEIVRFSLTDGSRTVVHSYASGDYLSGGWCSFMLDASADYLAWDDNRSALPASQQARIFNLATGIETTISGDTASSTQVWDDIVVFDEPSSTAMVAKVYNTSTGSTTPVVEGSYDTWYPSIWSNLVTWSDARAGGNYANMTNADIYIKDLSTGDETPICTHAASQFGSEIHENLVVWTDLRDDAVHQNDYSAALNWNIYGRWISSGVEFRITSLPTRERSLLAFNNHVFFWMEDSSGMDSIFMTDVHP